MGPGWEERPEDQKFKPSHHPAPHPMGTTIWGPCALSPQASAQPAQPGGSHGVAHSPQGARGARMGVITGHRLSLAEPPSTPSWPSTFRVRSESESSELSCTSMSGAWYLEDRAGGSGARTRAQSPTPRRPRGRGAGQRASEDLGLWEKDRVLQGGQAHQDPSQPAPGAPSPGLT